MTDVEEFVRKISFIDFHIPEEKTELIKKLREILEFEQTKQKEGLEDILREYPPEIQEEEVEFLNIEQNTRILFLERLIQLVLELPIIDIDSVPEKPEESSGENNNSPKPDSEDKDRPDK